MKQHTSISNGEPTRRGRLGAASRAMTMALIGAALVTGATPVGAQPATMRLRITLQPDCFRPSLDAACDRRKTGTLESPRLDLGPQIAIWLESADGTRFVDTVLVTNLTALLGIGNRPGYEALQSAPKFPYGRRAMSLPVWAHRRGKLYDSVVMQDGADREYWLGFHESVSSPDPYFCRPMSYNEVDVDAVSCPTQRFNSAKGRFYDKALDEVAPHVNNGKAEPYVPPAKSYYPPRNDLRTFTSNDCNSPLGEPCEMSARRYADINDLDLVAAATPAYGRPFTKLWRIPDDLPDGDYAVMVEVNKEYDSNEHHLYPSRPDPMLLEWGIGKNFGQPSVLYRVPIRVSRTGANYGATTTSVGYGDADGKSGTLHPPDGTISDKPGSGVGRLLTINQSPGSGFPSVAGRVLVATEVSMGSGGFPTDAGEEPDADDAGVDGAADAGVPADVPLPPGGGCEIATASPLQITIDKVEAEVATISFIEPPTAIWQSIDEYKIHRWSGEARSDEAFISGVPLATVAKHTPGGHLTVQVPNLKSESQYTVGARAVGACGETRVGYGSFTTLVREFTQLSGCFVATAAFGSPLAADVSLLRRVRDRATQAEGVAAAAADAYGRASPPVAHLLSTSPAARAVARGVLRPLVEIARIFDAASPQR